MKATIKILCLLRLLLICFNDLSGTLAESLGNKYTFYIASTQDLVIKSEIIEGIMFSSPNNAIASMSIHRQPEPCFVPP